MELNSRQILAFLAFLQYVSVMAVQSVELPNYSRFYVLIRLVYCVVLSLIPRHHIKFA